MRHLLLIPVLLTVACATTPEPKNYADAARTAYEAGMDALGSGEFLYASQKFQEVRRRYPYSEYAALAELRGGDALFEQGKFIEAADVYRTFLKLRPSHPEAHYAAWREGLSLLEEAPDDFVLFPPAYEKDLTQIRETIDVLEDFIRNYPDSPHVPEAKTRLAGALRRLADHELYVADFYRKKNEWQGVVYRLEGVLTRWPGLEDENWIRVDLAEAYLNLDEPQYADAGRMLDTVLAGKPEPDVKVRAEALKARSVVPAAAPESKPAPESEAAPDATPEASEAPTDADASDADAE